MPQPGIALEYALRTIIVGSGIQYMTLKLIDHVLLRQRKLWPVFLFVLSKAYILGISSYCSSFSNNPHLIRMNVVLNMVLTAGVYLVFLLTWKDDTLHTLLIFIISEVLSMPALIVMLFANLLEGREMAELIGPVRPIDFLIPIFMLGIFFLLRPFLYRIMEFLGNLYFPHRRILWLIVLVYFLYSHIPAFIGNNIGEKTNYVIMVQFVLMCCLGVTVILLLISHFLSLQTAERERIRTQLQLLRKRAEVTHLMHTRILEGHEIITRQMDMLQKMEEEKNAIDSTLITDCLNELQKTKVREYRGVYCSELLIDEVLSQIRQDAEQCGMNTTVHMQGFQLGRIREEDLTQLLYCLGYACIDAAKGNARVRNAASHYPGGSADGNLKISVMTSGSQLILQFIAPAFRISRRRMGIVRSILREYRGSLRMDHTGTGWELTVFMRSEGELKG